MITNTRKVDFCSGGSLSHHGIKGQRWGIRRYQNKDGSLTAKGKMREKARGGSASRGIITGVAVGSAIGLSALGISIAVTRGKNYVKKSPSLLKKLSEVETRDLTDVLGELGISPGDGSVPRLRVPLSKGGWKTI